MALKQEAQQPRDMVVVLNYEHRRVFQDTGHAFFLVGASAA
jgi:hypothetical protein